MTSIEDMFWKQVLVLGGVLEVRYVVVYVFQTCAVCPQGTGPFVKDSALTLLSLSMYTAAFSQTEHERQAENQASESLLDLRRDFALVFFIFTDAHNWSRYSKARFQNKHSVFSACKCTECIVKAWWMKWEKPWVINMLC